MPSCGVATSAPLPYVSLKCLAKGPICFPLLLLRHSLRDELRLPLHELLKFTFESTSTPPLAKVLSDNRSRLPLACLQRKTVCSVNGGLINVALLANHYARLHRMLHLRHPRQWCQASHESVVAGCLQFLVKRHRPLRLRPSQPDANHRRELAL